MDSITLNTLEQRLSESVGDYIRVAVTTAITAGVTITSTNLNAYDFGNDDTFNNWWIFIEDKANAGVERKVKDYATSGGVLTVEGVNLTTDVAILTDDSGTATGSPISLTLGANTVEITVQGTFTIALPSDGSGTAATDTATVTDGPVTLVAGNNTITVVGTGNITVTIDAPSFRLYRYRRTNKEKAINEAIRELYPVLHKRIDNRDLITGNIIPNGHFEDQATSGTPDKYVFTNSTGSKETTIVRGGATAIKVTDSGSGNGYMALKSSTWLNLLDLSGQVVDVHVWAYTESSADDAFITIYTADKDGNTQTLSSTTTMDAATWTLISLTDQLFNDDLVNVHIRFRVKSTSKFVVFDDARLISTRVFQYLLPTELDDGDIQQVFIQTSGNYKSSDGDIKMCDSVFGHTWERISDWDIVNDGTSKCLGLNDPQLGERRIRILGTAPFSSLSSQTDAIVIDQEKVPLLLAYAKYKLFQFEEEEIATEDISRFERASLKAYREYLLLSNRLRMGMPSKTMKLRRI